MTCPARLVNKEAEGLSIFSILVLSKFYLFSLYVFCFVDRLFERHALDYMRCRSRNFKRFLEINHTARLRILKKNFCISKGFVILGNVQHLAFLIFQSLRIAKMMRHNAKPIFYLRNGINF